MCIIYKMIRKNKKPKKTKKRINRKLKALNNEVKRLELLMKQRQLMTLGNYGGGGAPSLPTSSVATSLATNDLKNALADQKDKHNYEIVQYTRRLADMEHKNADNVVELADIEKKHAEDNALIDSTLEDHSRALQNGLLFVAHLGTRIDTVAPRISTRSQTPQQTRTRIDQSSIASSASLQTPTQASSTLQIPLFQTPNPSSSTLHIPNVPLRQDKTTIDRTIEAIVAPTRQRLTDDERHAIRVETAKKTNSIIAQKKIDKIAARNAKP